MALTSLAAIILNLPDALFGDAENLSQRRYRLAVFVSCTNFSIAFAFGGCAIGDGDLREF
jgi:hypothetical protein